MSIMIPIICFVPFFVWLFMYGMGRGKSCPECNKSLAGPQSPFTKTKRMWMKGGHICKNCGCESDFAGNKVHSKTTPLNKWTVIGIIVLSMSLPAFMFLTLFIANR